MLLISARRSSGQSRVAIRATIDATALPNAKRLRIGVRLTSSSMIMAKQPPNHAAVVIASNMFEFGQRSATYQRSMMAKVWRLKAIANKPRPIHRAAGQR